MEAVELARRNAELEASNAALRRAIQELESRVDDAVIHCASLKAERDQLQTTIRLLKAERERLLRRLFSPRSEKLDPAQIELFRAELLAEADAELAAELAAKEAARAKDDHEQRVPAKSNGRRRLPSELRRERREYTLPESERICPCCKVVMQPFGEDVSEQIEYVPANLFVIENARIKYACRGCEQGVRIAPAPAQPIEKGLPGPALLAHVALSKYGHHLPLYRLEQIFAEQGCPISRKTMCDWVEQIAESLAPVVREQKRLLLAEPLLQADETPVPYQNPMRKGKLSQGYLWAYTKPWAEVVFDFTPTRSAAGPKTFLNGFGGHLQTDGYAGYASLFELRTDARIGCLAHVRRKFFEAQHETEDSAGTALAAIQRIYRIERRCRDGDVRGPDLIKVRQTEVLPILDELASFFAYLEPKTLPQSLIGKAVRYAMGQWPSIRRFVSVAEAEADNNSCEQTIRTPVLGRKNWLFAGSIEGGKRGAVIFSLVVTCKRLGINPAEYLADVIARVSTHPNTRIAELVPRAWKSLRDQTAATA
ncbi:MAG TPA: IS66 family transposase [Candidatus Binatia bacterium]|nr:IS66 family transposase [Candidatus Binatia bacterium]